MVFCNKSKNVLFKTRLCSHNPYFNRWFSAMIDIKNLRVAKNCHNPYFNRWFSAIKVMNVKQYSESCHNPYFNRWFSAIMK